MVQQEKVISFSEKALALNTVVLPLQLCHGGSTDVCEKLSRCLQKKSVRGAALANFAQLKVTKGKKSLLTASGQVHQP